MTACVGSRFSYKSQKVVWQVTGHHRNEHYIFGLVPLDRTSLQELVKLVG